MKILFYLGHPAHYHLFKNVFKKLKARNHQIRILITKKDVLEELLKNDGLDYLNILPEGRGDNNLAKACVFIKRSMRLFKIAGKFRPHLMIGTSLEISYVGKCLNIPACIVNEDDSDAVPLFAKIAYPLASHILAPSSCEIGKWRKKCTYYDGYHELAYLHPNQFTPIREKIKPLNPTKDFFLLRLSSLSAHHDKGVRGITEEISSEIIKVLSPHGKIFISSERELLPKFEKYRMNISPNDMHHALAYASMCIGDSQTMTAEAAVLGTPAIRFNDFVGRLGYLDEIEFKYNLTYGIKTDDPNKLLDTIKRLFQIPNLKSEWGRRRDKMLEDKIDVASFMSWLLENYPSSIQTLKENPAYQYNFK